MNIEKSFLEKVADLKVVFASPEFRGEVETIFAECANYKEVALCSKICGALVRRAIRYGGNVYECDLCWIFQQFPDKEVVKLYNEAC